jgi:transcriptional regulator with XRE-family HTH domain
METRLQAARKRQGWGQQRLITELGRAAKRRGVMLPGRDSLKAQISRWENGRVQPSELYRALLCEVYQLADDDLGPHDQSPQDDDIRDMIERASGLAPHPPQHTNAPPLPAAQRLRSSGWSSPRALPSGQAPRFSCPRP